MAWLVLRVIALYMSNRYWCLLAFSIRVRHLSCPSIVIPHASLGVFPFRFSCGFISFGIIVSLEIIDRMLLILKVQIFSKPS